MTDHEGDGAPAAEPTRPCPICGKPSEVAWRPFCSNRCANVDLNRWLSGAYAVPGPDDPVADDAEREGP